MSQEVLQRVQQLIAEGRFDEARALLRTVDQPEVSQLLALIDQMEQTSDQAEAIPPATEAAPAPPQEPETDLLSRLSERRKAFEKGALLHEEGDRRVYDAGTYQMLWDCQFCGTKKLLGLTHRFCPNCGAPQDPDARYYPAEDEMIAVEDHKYVGEDQVCPACDTLNSASAEFCGNCGSPLTAAARAKKLAEERRSGGAEFASSGSRDVVKEAFDSEMQRVGVQAAPAARSKSGMPGWLPVALIILAVVICGGIAATLFITNDTGVTVAGHTWTREIRIEQYTAVSDSAWCDSVPMGAYSISRQREVRSYRQIPDGERCETVRRDNGDGTFRMEQQCTTIYRDEPVYADKCYFTVDTWVYERSVTSEGSRLEAPAWPDTRLSCAGQPRLGCEREANRAEEYVLYLTASEGGAEYTCPVEYALWQNASVNSRWNMEVGAVLGDARCETLERVQ